MDISDHFKATVVDESYSLLVEYDMIKFCHAECFRLRLMDSSQFLF